MTRRQVLRSLCAAALAAVAPIPAMGTAEIPFRKNIVDFDNGTVYAIDCPAWKMTKHEFRMNTTGADVMCYCTYVGE